MANKPITREKNSAELTEHFFRNEYGKLVSVITRYLGTSNIESAEDIVQETMLKASENWKHTGIPPNPQAWLYTTAKNITFNVIKHKKVVFKHEDALLHQSSESEAEAFSEVHIKDEQLKMMFVCCHSSIPENSQIALILKILCGFSISEIAQAFYTNNETINKRLVRARKSLRENEIGIELSNLSLESSQIVLKTIYLLFNEGYSPNLKNVRVRYDLCLEAIRLAEILYEHNSTTSKSEAAALLALMYLNAARFLARNNEDLSKTTLELQDRSLWDQELITSGIHYLNAASNESHINIYLILAAISANHCVAKNYEETNWAEILRLYDDLILLENSPITRINRCVALSKAVDVKTAIDELTRLSKEVDLSELEIYHATIGEFFRLQHRVEKAQEHLKKALSLSSNERNSMLLEKKLEGLVPN